MNEVLIALVIFMLGVIIGSVIGVATLLIIYFVKKHKANKTELFEREKRIEELKENYEDIKKSYEELLRDLTSKEKHYNNAFEFTDAVLRGEEDFR